MMLSSDIPVIVCFISKPNNLIDSVLSKYTNQSLSQEFYSKGYFSYQKKTNIEQIHTLLYLKHLNIDLKFKSKRENQYRGSIGIIFCFSEINQENNEIIIKILNEIDDQGYFEDYQKSVFIISDESDDKIENDKGRVSGIFYEKIGMKDSAKFELKLKAFIQSSNFFQVTIKGSCDL